MKNIGVWLDKNKALVVTLNNGNETIKTIPSNLEHFKISGGSGTKAKGGPQDVVQDSRYLEREKQQFKAYFKNIIAQIKTADALVIFGPAEANIKFKTALEENYKDLYIKVKDVVKVNSMTNNQLKAWVVNYFK